MGGATHLAAWDDASPEANADFALAYCQQRNASFAAAGALRRGLLPAPLARHARAVSTYSPASRATCAGGACPFIAVLECVPAGAAPCAPDASGNIGCAGHEGAWAPARFAP